MYRTLFAVLLLLAGSTGAAEPRLVAHRGASRDAPENTLPAFKVAWEQGADAIEGDFHVTRDGRIVCIHDGNTARVSSTNLIIRESSLEELRRLDVGAYRGKAFKGTVIPTLDEVLATVPEGKSLYIEIKCGAEIIPGLIDRIRASGLKDRQVVVICFNKTVLRAFKAAAPQYKALWLCSFEHDKEGKPTPDLETVLSTLSWIKADGLDSNAGIPEEFAAGVLGAGYEWHVWTVDDPQTAARMKKLGVQSITSNTVVPIRKALAGLQAAAAPAHP